MTFHPQIVPTEIHKLEAVRYADIIRNIDPATLDDAKLERMCELKRVLDAREISHKILYYEPQAHQIPFHKSTAKIRLVCGGNQSGKSVSEFNEGIWTALGIHPWNKRPTPNRGRIVATDLKEGIGEIVQNHFDEWLPASEVRSIKKGPTGVISKLVFKNRSTIDFLSYEQDKKVFESWVGDWASFDEPPPRHAYIGTLRGLMRRKGTLWIAATPLTEPWMYDEIYLKDGIGGIEVFNYDMWDNKYVSREEKELFLSKLTKEEREAREHGRFRHLSGLIHKQFDRKVHCVSSFTIPKEWPRHFALDYHPQKPCVMVWAAVTPKDKLVIYDELVVNMRVSEIAARIKDREGTRRAVTVAGDKSLVKIVRDPMKMRWIDPLSATPDRTSIGGCALREFARHGIRCRGWGKNFTVGKNAVDEYLALDKEGKPGIYFFNDKVPLTINSYLHYQWNDYDYDKDNVKEKPKQRFSDLPDCVRGIALHRPKYPRNENPEDERSDYDAHPHTGYGH